MLQYKHIIDKTGYTCINLVITLGAHVQRGYGSWVGLSVTQHLTFPMFVCLTNDTTYLMGNEGQKFRAVLSENAPLQARVVAALYG